MNIYLENSKIHSLISTLGSYNLHLCVICVYLYLFTRSMPHAHSSLFSRITRTGIFCEIMIFSLHLKHSRG